MARLMLLFNTIREMTRNGMDDIWPPNLICEVLELYWNCTGSEEFAEASELSELLHMRCDAYS
jgi:hypothetical protein